MLNNLVWLQFFIFPSYVYFLLLSILFCISLFLFNSSIKDLIVDYLPALTSGLSFWKEFFMAIGCFLLLGLFIY